MKKDFNNLLRRLIFLWLPGALSLALGLGLAVQCLRLYQAGLTPSHMNEAGACILPIYSRQLAVEYARPLLLPALLWGCSIAVGGLAQLLCPELNAAQKTAVRHQRPSPAPQADSKALPALRMALLGAALLLILAGVLNGGMYDVLVKAINLCTECIGLG